MSVQILSGYSWGVDEETISQGAGAGAVPQVLSATSTAPDRVRIVFNQPMDVDSIGRFQDYRIVSILGGVELGVVGLLPVSNTEVDLITNGQLNTNYEVTVTRVQDTWGVPINDAADNTASFAGTDMGTLYPTATLKNSFYGLESGMQSAAHPNFNPDLAAPVLDNQNPLPTATGVLRDSNVYLEIEDVLNSIDAASVSIEVGGVLAWSADTQQPGFAVTKGILGSGYSYDIDPDIDFTSYQSVVVHVVAKDTAPIQNTLDTTYSFTVEDFEDPYLSAQAPFPGETGVSPIVHVILRVLDDGTGLDAASIVVKIDGVNAWASGSLQAGFVGTQTPVVGGYEYDLQPTTPFTPLVVIPVQVIADDLDANSLNTSYSFTVGFDISPQFENLDPVENATDVPATQVISFDITDNIAVDPTKTRISVNDVLIYVSEVAQNGFTVVRSAVLNGYNYLVTGPSGWEYGTEVNVYASARDTIDTFGEKAWSFSIEEDPTCFAGPLNTVENDLLTPFTSLVYTERLRKTLLAAVVTSASSITAARTVFLNAYAQELAPVLNQMVTAPTDAERAVRLCHRATNLEVSDALRRKINLLPGAIQELQNLGLPREHAVMLNAYAAEDQPNTEVPLACLIVLLAKALE